MEDITIDNQPSDKLPEVTRDMLAELLRNIAHYWPEKTVCSASQDIWSADMVRAALHACAAMIERTDQKRTPYDILAEDFGLKLARMSGDKQVRVIGVRASGGQRSVWDIRVERADRQACVLIDNDPVITIYGETGIRPSLLEKIAVRSVLALLVEKKRFTRAERRRRAKARKEVQA